MDQSSDACLEVRLPHSVRAPALARDALAAVRPHLAPERYADLRLLVSELITNSIVHGIPGEPVHLRVAVTEDVAQVEVEDPGGGFTATGAVPGPQDVSGRGLAILEAIADRWGVTSTEPTRVWFQMSADAPGLP